MERVADDAECVCFGWSRHFITVALFCLSALTTRKKYSVKTLVGTELKKSSRRSKVPIMVAQFQLSMLHPDKTRSFEKKPFLTAYRVSFVLVHRALLQIFLEGKDSGGRITSLAWTFFSLHPPICYHLITLPSASVMPPNNNWFLQV